MPNPNPNHNVCSEFSCTIGSRKEKGSSARAELPFIVKERGVPACKPNSVCLTDARSHPLREAIIYLERLLPTASSDLPAPLLGGPPSSRRHRARMRCCLALHLVGFAWPPRLPECAGALLPHPFTPYLIRGRAAAIGGTALCCTCRHQPVARLRPPVRRHDGPWCSDFPHRFNLGVKPTSKRSDSPARTPYSDRLRTCLGFGLQARASGNVAKMGPRMRFVAGATGRDRGRFTAH